MIVIIPAAGEGKRLADVQPGIPKALKRIGGKPMICHTLEKTRGWWDRTHTIIIVVRPRDAAYFKALLQYDIVYWRPKFIEQPDSYGTGDAVWRALESVSRLSEQPCLVMYPDILLDLSIEDFIFDVDISTNTVMTKPRDGSGSCVYRCPSEPDRVISVSEKPRNSMGNVGEKLGDWYFVTNAMYLYLACKCLAGLSWEGYEGVVKPEKTNREFSLTQAIDALMRCGLPFRGVRVENYYGMGNPEAFARAEEYLKSVAE